MYSIVSERLTAEEYIDFLKRTDLGSQYPRERFWERIARLLENASVSLAARNEEGRLIGVLLGLTDFAYWLYVTDLGVDRRYGRQGIGRGLGDSVKVINEYAVGGLYPDATFLLDISPEEGRKRNGKTGKSDRLEKQSMEYHAMVSEGYRKLAAAEPDRFIVIDASADIGKVAADIADAFEKRYPDIVPQR